MPSSSSSVRTTSEPRRTNVGPRHLSHPRRAELVPAGREGAHLVFAPYYFRDLCHRTATEPFPMPRGGGRYTFDIAGVERPFRNFEDPRDNGGM